VDPDRGLRRHLHALVDVTIVQVALPTMQRQLHASFADLEWVISAYALSLAALILTQGTLADRFGRKRIFMVVWPFSRWHRWCAAWPTAPPS